jgi:hypothetical protein
VIAPDQFPGLSGRCFTIGLEEALLLSCANIHAPDRIGHRLRSLLERPLRWDRVLTLGNAHGVVGLVRWTLRKNGLWDAVPDEARTVFDRWYRAAQIRHLLIARQLASILEGARAAGVDPVLLKGAAIAAVAYPDPALRAMADIDALVDPTQLSAMSDVLTRLGLAHEEIYYGDVFNVTRGYHLSFFDPIGTLVPVEVHWALASSLERRNRLSASALLRHTVRARVVTIPNVARPAGRVLAPAAQLVYLASHAGTEGHSFSQLRWLADIAAIVGGPTPPPWPAVVAFARHSRARAVTYVALALVRDLLGVVVPASALHELRPPVLLTGVIERTLNPSTILAPLDQHRRSIVKYLLVDSPAMTTRLLVERLLPPADAIRVYHPGLGQESLTAAYGRQVVTVTAEAIRKATSWLHPG